LSAEENAEEEEEQPEQEDVREHLPDDLQDVDHFRARRQENLEFAEGPIHQFQDPAFVEHIYVVVLLVRFHVLFVFENKANQH
jgi:hypothetical protein